MTLRFTATLVLATAFLPACGYRTLDPPRAPSRALPAVVPRSTPPAPGLTRVVLDANGERARVLEVTALSTGFGVGLTGEGTVMAIDHRSAERPVCHTPCVADFEPGLHILKWSSLDDTERLGIAEVQIGEETRAIRHAMGRVEPPSNGQVLGVSAVTLGVIALLTGGLILARSAGNDDEEFAEVGGVVAAAGGTLIGVGAVITFNSRGTIQKGATTIVGE